MTVSVHRISLVLLTSVLLVTTVSAETLVVHNVRVYTPIGDDIDSYAGLVITDGKVRSLLTADDELPSGPDVRRIDGGGKTLLPGLIDAHGHVLSLGQEQLQVDLRDSDSIAVAVGRVRQFAQKNPTDRWIIGSGWNQVLWPDKQFPQATDLDAAVSDRPALLSRVDGHAVLFLT